VVLPASAIEGQAPFQGIVQAAAIPTADILVGLSSSDPARLQVQPSVLIPAGQTSAVFTVTVTDNIVVEGPQTASITAHVPNWTDGFVSIVILDNDTPTNGVFVAPGSIAIPDHGAGTPYPAANTVAGMWGTIAKMTVTISNLWHTWPADLDILLVSPTGSNVILMADAGYSYPLSGVTLTFDDAASAILPPSSQITSGTYQPTSYETIGNNWPAPAPGPPWGAALSVFKGTDPNGVWKLYVFDDAAADQGSISNGWRLSFTTSGPSLPFIQQPLLSSDQFKFQFATVAGHTYFVEYKNALTNPVWSAVQSFAGDGTMKTVTDPMTAGQRFYRVRMQ
jgi:subtilisin-like proprotein convertase family protein